MLTRLTVRNFKRFEEVDIDLDSPVLFIGPNNSGKTTALQALALWNLGMRRWNEKRSGSETPTKRPGVTVNRRDLLAVPNAERPADLEKPAGSQRAIAWTDASGPRTSASRSWSKERRTDAIGRRGWSSTTPTRSRSTAGRSGSRAAVRHGCPSRRTPGASGSAYLPPMSGLAANELRLEPGGVAVRLGEGRTAEVLRNLCFRVSTEMPDEWARLVERIEDSFGGSSRSTATHRRARSEIAMSYTEGGVRLDVTATGRGMQQTILLLAHLALNAGSVLILDEPDAHLEVIRQREIYEMLRDAAMDAGSQIIAASHSEVLLQSAGGRDAIIAFVGQPHRIADRGGQVLTALRDIGIRGLRAGARRGFRSLPRRNHRSRRPASIRPAARS